MTDWGKWATAFVAAFDESKVRRDGDGQFARKTGGGIPSGGSGGVDKFLSGDSKAIKDKLDHGLTDESRDSDFRLAMEFDGDARKWPNGRGVSFVLPVERTGVEHSEDDYRGAVSGAIYKDKNGTPQAVYSLHGEADDDTEAAEMFESNFKQFAKSLGIDSVRESNVDPSTGYPWANPVHPDM